MRTKDVVIDRDEAEFIVWALKRYEVYNGESDMSRLLLQRFRRVRSLLSTKDERDTPEAQAEIFSAGADA